MLKAFRLPGFYKLAIGGSSSDSCDEDEIDDDDSIYQINLKKLYGLHPTTRTLFYSHASTGRKRWL